MSGRPPDRAPPDGPPPDGAPPALAWSVTGGPRSVHFDDVYFSERDGRAETRHVFLSGNDLPARWRPDGAFTIAELGFGVGLNFLETWSAWARWRRDLGVARADRAELRFVSVERWPPAADDLRRALARWPELAARGEALLRAFGARSGDWPPAAGWTTRALPDAVTLTLGVGDARRLLPAHGSGLDEPAWRADAFFLDGFAPARNPELWEAGLLQALARRAAPDATAATYSAAGIVKRGLRSAGFEVAKSPGYGAKRDMLRAWRSDPPPS